MAGINKVFISKMRVRPSLFEIIEGSSDSNQILYIYVCMYTFYYLFIFFWWEGKNIKQTPVAVYWGDPALVSLVKLVLFIY